MKPKNIWLVVPFSRPNYLENVKENINRQSYKDIKVCIVENGDAIGHCDKVGFKPDLLLTSGNHQSKAKNTGIEAIKEKGGGFVSIFDDDDYYGPNYLQEVWDNSENADVIGKFCVITKLTNNEIILINDVGLFNTYVPRIHGSTASYWAEDAFPYGEHMISGEDDFWSGQMIRSGKSIYATTPFNYCYMRRSDTNHTYKATDKNFIDDGSKSIGTFDLNIINRIKNIQLLEDRANAISNYKELKKRKDRYKEEVEKILEKNKLKTKRTEAEKNELLQIVESRKLEAMESVEKKRLAQKEKSDSKKANIHNLLKAKLGS